MKIYKSNSSNNIINLSVGKEVRGVFLDSIFTCNWKIKMLFIYVIYNNFKIFYDFIIRTIYRVSHKMGMNHIGGGEWIKQKNLILF